MCLCVGGKPYNPPLIVFFNMCLCESETEEKEKGEAEFRKKNNLWMT